MESESSAFSQFEHEAFSKLQHVIQKEKELDLLQRLGVSTRFLHNYGDEGVIKVELDKQFRYGMRLVHEAIQKDLASRETPLLYRVDENGYTRTS